MPCLWRGFFLLKPSPARSAHLLESSMVIARPPHKARHIKRATSSAPHQARHIKRAEVIRYAPGVAEPAALIRSLPPRGPCCIHRTLIHEQEHTPWPRGAHGSTAFYASFSQDPPPCGTARARPPSEPRNRQQQAPGRLGAEMEQLFSTVVDAGTSAGEPAGA